MNSNTQQDSDSEQKQSFSPILTSKPTYPKNYKILFFIMFLIVGLINNLGSVLIVTCSQQFAKQLDNERLVAFYPMGVVLCSSLCRLANSKFCLRIKYHFRILFISIYFTCGYLFMFIILHLQSHLNKTVSFALSLIPSLIMGTGTALGEANMLGYIRTFPEDYISGWGTGTGFAGISGATITLLFKMYKLQTKMLYLYVSPVGCVYFLSFYMSTILREKAEKEIIRLSKVQPIMSNDEPNEERIIPKENDNADDNNNDNNNTEITDEKQNKNFNCANFREGFRTAKRYIINLCLVYYLEYVIYTGFSERVSTFGYVDHPKIKNYLYEYLCLCCAFGVLISRSSLFIVKHNKCVELYTIIQGCNLIFWIIEIYTKMITTWWILFIHLVIVGLCGGSSYVGCFYFLINTEKIDPTLRELCMNIATIFNDLGILSSAITMLILDNTILKKSPIE